MPPSERLCAHLSGSPWRLIRPPVGGCGIGDRPARTSSSRQLDGLRAEARDHEVVCRPRCSPPEAQQALMRNLQLRPWTVPRWPGCISRQPPRTQRLYGSDQSKARAGSFHRGLFVRPEGDGPTVTTNVYQSATCSALRQRDRTTSVEGQGGGWRNGGAGSSSSISTCAFPCSAATGTRIDPTWRCTWPTGRRPAFTLEQKLLLARCHREPKGVAGRKPRRYRWQVASPTPAIPCWWTPKGRGGGGQQTPGEEGLTTQYAGPVGLGGLQEKFLVCLPTTSLPG